MPTCRSIRIALHSQFDAELIPEYYPLSHSTGDIKHADDASSTCSVYIPTFPGSTFWIRYSIIPPVPNSHYFLFKLYINGTHIVNWSTGKEDGWKGKTMFGLYERSEDKHGKRKIEKRALRFAPTINDKVSKGLSVENMCMEIRVHRAHGRKRIERKMEDYSKTPHAKNARGIDLVNAGRASSEQPKRFYKFALIDAIDQPFATFKYMYRTWDQLETLGLLEDDYMSTFGTSEASVGIEDKATDDVFYQRRVGASPKLKEMENSSRMATAKRLSPLEAKRPSTWEAPEAWNLCTSIPEQLRTYVPRGAPEALKKQRQSTNPESSSSATAYRPHPVYKVEDGQPESASPLRSCNDSPAQPLVKHGNPNIGASALMNVISSTWKRCRTPNAEKPS